MQLVTATEGMRGIDVNESLNAAQAKQIKDAGYSFVMRYVPRDKPAPHDITRAELQILLDAGLLVGFVQHVKSETSWIPTPELGTYYGQHASMALHDLGVIAGSPIWLDLEGVDVSVSHDTVIEYCHNWHEAVGGTDDSGLYVGWHAGLTPQELYEKLPFKRYWGAYNLNADEFPAVRGLQMKQHAATSAEIAQLGGMAIDTDTVLTDKKGDLPVFLGN